MLAKGGNKEKPLPAHLSMPDMNSGRCGEELYVQPQNMFPLKLISVAQRF